MSNIFGFACTSIQDVQDLCEGIIGRDKVQVMSGRDSVANRRCYIMMGVSSLSPAMIQQLSRCRGVLVLLDCPPEISRVQGITLMDIETGTAWQPMRISVVPLRKSLRASPKPINVRVERDTTVENLVDDVRSRGILDRVLAVARAMSPAERTQLHTSICRHLSGDMALSTVMRRVRATGARPSLVTALEDALNSEVALRITKSLHAIASGNDVVIVAAENRVDPSELRFILSHLGTAGDNLKETRKRTTRGK